jgi:methylated-DNA-[protein]-cysteine S-methyltransferase
MEKTYGTRTTTVASPVGELLLVGQETADGFTLTSVSMNDAEPFAAVIGELEAYFAGELTTFDLPFAAGGTEFQQRVWRAVDEIPYGTTTTYGAIAARLGLPRDRIQAVGAAIGANPLLVVRPCHRVVGSDGSMRGYAGGVERKAQLLTHEGALLA